MDQCIGWSLGCHLSTSIEKRRRVAPCPDLVIRHRPARRKAAARVRASDDMASNTTRAKQFYEEAWAGNLELMPGLMAEGHIQRDMVWQGEPRVGRDSMTKGIESIRALYPDIAFRVLDACACSSSNKVFVHWSMSGTSEGERAETSGMSLMSFDSEGRIAETQVYRQALPAEVKRAQERGIAVPQGALLDT